MQEEYEVMIGTFCYGATEDLIALAKSKPDDPDGQKADLMSALIMMYFMIETTTNTFLARQSSPGPTEGYADRIREYSEPETGLYWKPLKERIETFYENLDLQSPSFGERPFQTITELKNIRDSIAHGKPYVKERYGGTRTGKLEPRWEQECTVEKVEDKLKDLIEVYKHMLGAAQSCGCSLGNPLECYRVES